MLTGQAVSQRTGAVRLQRGNDEILHDLDLGLPLQAGFRFFEGSLDLGDVEPSFVLVKARLDVADALEVFVELVRVGFGETALHTRLASLSTASRTLRFSAMAAWRCSSGMSSAEKSLWKT